MSAQELAVVTDPDLFARLGHLVIDHDNKNFYQGWLRQELLINRCADCGYWRHPPRPICPQCWSFDVVPTKVSGRGVIFMLTFLHYGPAVEGVDYSGAGHPVAVVELEEQQNLRFTTTVVGWEPGKLQIGTPVELTWITRHDAPFPAFRPVAGTPAEER